MAISTLTTTTTLSVVAQGTNNITGTDYTPLASSQTVTKKVALGTSVANNLAGGSDEAASFLMASIVASGSANIDLTSLTDIMQTAAVTLARVKVIVLRLLSATDDATNGTAASSITIDNTLANALSAQSHSGWFDNAAEGAANGSKFTIPNGGFLAFSTGGTNTTGVVVDSSHKLIKVVNNDGGVAARPQATIIGGST